MMTSSSLTEINSAGTDSRTKVKAIDYLSAALQRSRVLGGGVNMAAVLSLIRFRLFINL